VDWYTVFAADTHDITGDGDTVRGDEHLLEHDERNLLQFFFVAHDAQAALMFADEDAVCFDDEFHRTSRLMPITWMIKAGMLQSAVFPVHLTHPKSSGSGDTPHPTKGLPPLGTPLIKVIGYNVFITFSALKRVEQE